MGKFFGTDGVRGIANTELDVALAMRIGQAGAYVLSREKHGKPRILIGMDTRISGPMLEAALVAGVCSVGGEAVCLGVVPTPCVAYLTRTMGFDAGIVVSASHNASQFNGIKFFNAEGYKLRDEIENEIEALLLENNASITLPTGGGVGRPSVMTDGAERYIQFAMSTVDVRFDGLKIALDCANGASCNTSPEAFRRLGAEVLVIHNHPDGVNINDSCGSTHMEDLQAFVVANQCDFGFAYDGDADRVLAVDETGALVDGDVMMAICANDMKARGTLKQDTMVATVMSNLGLFLMGEKCGISIPRTKVGDRYVLEEMADKGYSIGGEQSGHIIFLEHNTTGDGLVSSLQLAQVICRTKKKLSELKTVMTVMPQALVNAHVKKSGDTSYQNDREIMDAIAAVEAKFSGKGRVLIRPSGTEPLVRVMIEGEVQEEIMKEATALAALMESRLS